MCTGSWRDHVSQLHGEAASDVCSTLGPAREDHPPPHQSTKPAAPGPQSSRSPVPGTPSAQGPRTPEAPGPRRGPYETASPCLLLPACLDEQTKAPGLPRMRRLQATTAKSRAKSREPSREPAGRAGASQRRESLATNQAESVDLGRSWALFTSYLSKTPGNAFLSGQFLFTAGLPH